MSVSFAALTDVGWLTGKLLRVTLSSAEWVLWLLLALSVASLAVILERWVFFRSRRLQHGAEIAELLARGDLEAAASAARGPGGRWRRRSSGQGLKAVPEGPETVEQVMLSTMAASVRATSGSSRSSARWEATRRSSASSGRCWASSRPSTTSARCAVKGAAIQQTVMTGISEALVATAVGLAVAIPAVVGFNIFTRALKNLTGRTSAQAPGLRAECGQLRARTRGSGPERTPRRPAARCRGVVRGTSERGSAADPAERLRKTTRRSPGSTSPRWSTSCWCC